MGLLSVGAGRGLPTKGCLIIQTLIREVADYVRAPEAEAVGADPAIITKAQELGALRHSQQASVHQLLAESPARWHSDHLRSRGLARLDVLPTAEEAVEVMRRLNDAIWILTQTTVDTFVTEYTATSQAMPHAWKVSTGC